MDGTLERLHIGKAIAVGVAAFLASIVSLVVVLTVVHVVVNHGMPLDGERIEALGMTHGPMLSRLLAILFAFLGARWLAGRVGSRPMLHGVIVGAVVAVSVVGHGVAHLLLGDRHFATGFVDLAAALAIVAVGAGGAMTRDVRTAF